MTPLTIAPLQLAEWIVAIDVRMADLANQRVAFANALRCFDVEHLERTMPEEPPEALVVNPTIVPTPVAPVVRSEPSTGAETLRRKRPRGRASAPDYDAIARAYLDAVAAGRKPIDALCAEFGVERTTAKNWPAHCRGLGLLPARTDAHLAGAA